MDVVETAAACRDALDRAARDRAAPSGWCPPWGRCTTGTPPSWPGPTPSARWCSGQHLREPAAVRRPRRHRALPADARAATCSCAPRPARTSSSSRRSARSTRPGRRRRRPPCRWAGSVTGGGPHRARAISTASPPWSQAVLHRRPLPGLLRAEGLPAAGGRAPVGARPVAAHRGGGVPDRAGGGRPRAVQPQRAALGRRTGGRVGALGRAGRRPRRHRRRRALRRGRGAGHGGRRRPDPLVRLDYAVAVDAGSLEEVGDIDGTRARCACSSRPRWVRSG